MAKKRTTSKSATSKPRRSRKRAEPKSKGLTPPQCGEVAQGALDELAANVEGQGGLVLARYCDPLGGRPTVVAVLPIDKVSATPFQRDLSEAHAKRLADTLGKLGRFLDPIIAVPAGDGFWTPNGRHRLEAMTRLGARAITALVLPDSEIQYKILALNVEKAHNLREKALEVIRMYRVMAAADGAPESAHGLEFEEPGFITLGVCYENNGRFAGGAYHPILRRVDNWLEHPLKEALRAREARAAKLEKLDARVSEAVAALKEKGFRSPYLRSFVVARVNPLRFMPEPPPFDEALDMILKRAARFNPDKVNQGDIVATAAPMGEEEG
jgi:ParB family chromosome partitioning protein